MANQQFGNGQSQSPMSTMVPDGHCPPPTTVNMQQTSAFNLFMMGHGRANVQLGFPAPQGLMDYYGNVNGGMVASQQPQQQQIPVEFATAAGNTPSAYKSGVKPGSSASGSEVGEAPGIRMTRSKSKAVTFAYPPLSDAAPNGKSPLGNGNSDGGKSSTTSDQELFQNCNLLTSSLFDIYLPIFSFNSMFAIISTTSYMKKITSDVIVS
ncbi:4-hydroxy-3-methylbut-2-enyl diphosphate reductase [Orchesella cincta]|uniref:4-hydroxy-3-methylbut-2-enyl diphosphate reductase n=1 Tax=Orchesella cincta TaxID=48709 RepID=A0A1D2NGM8_ORCCI|nr:4-hydroxy-3-methylbut-2-enyl diphosphate reductase [Orchesella cincta]